MPNECWSELNVYGPRQGVSAFKCSASGPGLAPFVSDVAKELKLIELVNKGVGLQRAAKIVGNEIGYRLSAPGDFVWSPLKRPLRRNYSRWKKKIQQDLSREQKHYSSELRKALKNPNPLDLNQLLPLPPEISARGTEAILTWQTEHWDTKWNTWDVSVAPIRSLPKGLARLQYSFITAWGEPIGAIANASKSHRALYFVLTGIDASNEVFISHLIRGRVRTWRMPVKVWQKHAEMETEGEDEQMASYQPGIMGELVNHWEEAALAKLGQISNRERGSRALNVRVSS